MGKQKSIRQPCLGGNRVSSDKCHGAEALKVYNQKFRPDLPHSEHPEHCHHKSNNHRNTQSTDAEHERLYPHWYACTLLHDGTLPQYESNGEHFLPSGGAMEEKMLLN